MNVPERVASPEEPVRRGSVALGFGLAWLTMIAGYALLAGVASFGRGGTSFLSTFSMPWVVSILLIIWLVATHRARTALGVAIGLGSVLVICVGLFALLVNELSHNFH
jgi:hypothetical protein